MDSIKGTILTMRSDIAFTTIPKPKQKVPITVRSLIDIATPSGPHFHPDGWKIVFESTRPDFHSSRNITQLWMAVVENLEQETEEDEENEAEPVVRQLTFQRDGACWPRWSPDGKYLAFLSCRKNEEEPVDDEYDSCMQVWIMPEDGGEPTCLTHSSEGVLAFEWLPESEDVVYTEITPRPTPVEHYTKQNHDDDSIDAIEEPLEKRPVCFWKISITDKKPVLLHSADAGVDEFAISPDGVSIAYLTNTTGDPNDYHRCKVKLYDISNAVARDICERRGDKNNLRWAPNGEALAFLSCSDPDISFSTQSLFLMKIKDSSLDVEYPIPWVSKLETDSEGLAPLCSGFEHDVIEFQWSSTDGAVYALCAASTGTLLARFTEYSEVITFNNSSTRSDLALDTGASRTAWVEQDSHSLPELYLMDEEGNTEQITKLNEEFHKRYILPRQEVVRWKSDDDREIEGVITYPNNWDNTPAPLIVQIHGGPHGRSTDTLLSYCLHPVWAASGYAVLRPNYRGSEGYGNEFAICNKRDLGGGDYRDIMAGVQWCVDTGIADSSKLGVMGGSYGGYMTNWIIGHSTQFAAAISLFGIFHLQTDYSNSSLSRWDNDYLGAYYWEDPEIYARLSPGSFLNHINTPTLIIHGDDDNNTPIANSREMYQALKHRGVTSQFVHYPREGHGLNEPNHRLDEMRRCLSWMDRHILYGGSDPLRVRVGDAFNYDGWVMRVTRAECVSYAGKPENSDKEQLEVSFTLHQNSRSKTARRFRIEEVSLSLNGEMLGAIGVPIEVHGTRILLSGENMEALLHPDKETGQIAFGIAVCFLVPKGGGFAQFRLGSSSMVEIAWNGNDEQE